MATSFCGGRPAAMLLAPVNSSKNSDELIRIVSAAFHTLISAFLLLHEAFTGKRASLSLLTCPHASREEQDHLLSNSLVRRLRPSRSTEPAIRHCCEPAHMPA